MKVYERGMHDQMYEYFNKILSKQQCEFYQVLVGTIVFLQRLKNVENI